jgi:hypothetical protein
MLNAIAEERAVGPVPAGLGLGYCCCWATAGTRLLLSLLLLGDCTACTHYEALLAHQKH